MLAWSDHPASAPHDRRETMPTDPTNPPLTRIEPDDASPEVATIYDEEMPHHVERIFVGAGTWARRFVVRHPVRMLARL